MEVDEKNRFRFILLASCAIHFSFILLFPTLGISPKLLPEYLEIYLVKLSPKQIKKPLESKVITPAKEAEKLKVTLEPKKIAPEAKKETKTVAPEVSPVKISLPPAQKLPVLPPQVSEIEAPLVPQDLQPTFGEGIGPLPRLQKEREIEQGERLLPSGERTAKSEEGSLEGSALSLEKAVSPVKKGISYGGEGEGEGQVGVRIRGPVGERKIERPPELSYPAWAEEQGAEGEPEIRFRVSPDGIVIGAEIERTSGWPGLDEYAYQVLMKVKFGSIKGEEIQWSVAIFKFELE